MLISQSNYGPLLIKPHTQNWHQTSCTGEWLEKDRQKTLRAGGITLVGCYDEKCLVRVSKPEFISAYQHAQSRPPER